MGLEPVAGHHSFDRTLNEGDSAPGRLPLIPEPGVSGAVGEAISAFYAAVGFGEYLFRAHFREFPGKSR
jgi:hypothetical protein